MINKETLEEIHRAVDIANDGNWVPLLTLSVAMATILALLLYIWNLHQKQNKEEHSKTAKLLERITDNMNRNEMLMERVVTRQEHHENQIKALFENRFKKSS